MASVRELIDQVELEQTEGERLEESCTKRTGGSVTPSPKSSGHTQRGNSYAVESS